MKKALLLSIALTLLFAAQASADPLTDYRLGHFQIGAGYWLGTTDLAVSAVGVNNGLNYAQAKNGNFTADATIGLSHGFALRYGYTDLSNWYQTDKGGQGIDVYAHEVNLLFKIADSLGGLVGDTINLCSGKPLNWTPEPQGRSIYSLCLGYGVVDASTSTTDGTRAGNTSGYSIGIVNSSQLTDDLISFGRLSLTANASIFADAGLAYQFLPGTTVSIAYKNYNLGAYGSNSNNDTAFIYRSGFQFGLNYQY